MFFLSFHFWLPVLIASVSSFAIGAIWFGPKTFYPVWIRALGREVPTERVEMTKGETALLFGGTYVAALIQAATLATLIGMIGVALQAMNPVIGAFIGGFAGIGLTAFGSLSHRMFGQPDHKVFRSLKVWIIEVGQDVVTLIAAGAIIGAML